MRAATLKRYARVLAPFAPLALGLSCETADQGTAPPVGAPQFSLSAGAGVWTIEPSMPTGRYGLAAGVVNGILYAVGGRDSSSAYLATVEAYDPGTTTWTTKTPMPSARLALGVGVVNGTLYAVGGLATAGVAATLEAYNPGSDSWTAKTPMPTARAGLAVAVVNGTLYAIGGQTSGGYVGTVEAYDPTTDTWASRASMPTARSGLAADVVNGVIYAVGGYNGSYLATVEAYDPATDTWSAKAQLQTARQALGAGAANGILYAVGGDNSSELATVEGYDPTDNTWTTQAPMLTARSGLGVGVVSGVLYSVGGDGLRYLTTNEALRAGTIIFHDGFEGATLDTAWKKWPDTTSRYSLSSDTVHSGAQSLQVLFRDSTEDSQSGGYGEISHWFPGEDEIYVEFYVMFQAEFKNMRPDSNGMHFLTVCGDSVVGGNGICKFQSGFHPTGADWFYAGVDPEENRDSVPKLLPFSFYTYWWGMSCDPDPNCYGRVATQSSPKIPLVGGKWQQVIFHIKMNTSPLNCDGSQELWINGQGKIAQQGMCWRLTTSLKIEDILFVDYMGAYAPQHESLWIDDVTAWRP